MHLFCLSFSQLAVCENLPWKASYPSESPSAYGVLAVGPHLFGLFWIIQNLLSSRAPNMLNFLSQYNIFFFFFFFFWPCLWHVQVPRPWITPEPQQRPNTRSLTCCATRELLSQYKYQKVLPLGLCTCCFFCLQCSPPTPFPIHPFSR